MSQNPPRDYPDTRSTAAMGSPIVGPTDDPFNSPIHGNRQPAVVTLSSVKERLEAEQPVSDEMIHTAVTNLFAADSHDAYRQRSEHTMSKQSPVRGWLKKPGK